MHDLSYNIDRELQQVFYWPLTSPAQLIIHPLQAMKEPINISSCFESLNSWFGTWPLLHIYELVLDHSLSTPSDCTPIGQEFEFQGHVLHGPAAALAKAGAVGKHQNNIRRDWFRRMGAGDHHVTGSSTQVQTNNYGASIKTVSFLARYSFAGPTEDAPCCWTHPCTF